MNTFGNKFRLSIFGESHGSCLGVTIDGVPAGLPLSEEDFVDDIFRRSPAGASLSGTCVKAHCTSRNESDRIYIVSGIYNGCTTGAPLTLEFHNEDAQSSDYGQFTDVPRPGHSDYTASVKFEGFNDPRGGGHFSGRLTLPVVAAGTVAGKILAEAFSEFDTPDQLVRAKIVELGGLSDSSKWQKALEEAATDGDSLGAVVECEAFAPAGLGEPFWDSVESVISHMVFAIPGVRGIEFGDGFRAAAMRGSEHNDCFGPDGKPLRNGSGGLNGGISNGAPIVFRVAFKPTSSIAKSQTTLNFATGEMETLSCKGRHDVCFALRTPVIVEAVTKIVLTDFIL